MWVSFFVLIFVKSVCILLVGIVYFWFKYFKDVVSFLFGLLNWVIRNLVILGL